MDKSGSRSNELTQFIKSYQQEKEHMNKCLMDRASSMELRDKILDHYRATLEDWNSWEWQMTNRFTKPDTIAKLLNLRDEQVLEIHTAEKCHRMAISPFLLALFAPGGPSISKQFLPALLEKQYQHVGDLDPMGEKGLAIPSYVINMPRGLGKVVLKREANINCLDEDPIFFKTWENKVVPYSNRRVDIDDKPV